MCVQEGQISGAGVSGIKTPHHHHAVGGISWRQSWARCCTSAPACCSAARSRWRSRKRTQAFQRSTASSLSGAIRAVNLSEPSTRETRENEGTAGSHATSAGALSSLSRPRENAESKGKARFRDISSPGSRQLNAASSNNRISASPAWIRTTVHGYEKEFSAFLLSGLLVNAQHGLDSRGLASA